MKIKKNLMGRSFRYVRYRLKLTQQDLALQLQVNQSTISKIENGSHLPRPRLLQKLERLSQLRISDIYQQLP